MRKLTTLLALLCFLWVQAAAVLHAAEHGYGEHKHEGKQCELCVFSKHSDAIPPSYGAIKPYIISDSQQLTPYYNVPITSFQGNENPSRAPPLLS